ncbi:EAL domain-containing protein [Vibrio kasasachensis]
MSDNIFTLYPHHDLDLNLYQKVDEIPDTQSKHSVPLSGSQLDLIMNDHFKYIFDVFNDGLFYMTGQDHVFFYNPSFYEQFDINSGHIPFERWLEKVHPFDRVLLKTSVAEHILTEDIRDSVQYRVRNKAGQYIWIEGAGITKTFNGKRFIVGCHRDISDKKLMESYIHQTAFQDSSSGLANAHKLSVDIEKLCQDSDVSHSLIYAHLEDIRAYLSLYGAQTLHDLMAHFLSSLSGLPDNFVDIYRIRSDDFAILVRGIYSADEIEALGEQILSTYQESIEANGSLWGNDISIGIYPNFYPSQPSEEILKIAFRTCQFAREKQQNRLAIYHDKTQEKVNRHFYIERELSRAIQNERLSVRFQPIVDASSCKIVSFEALVRWKDKQLGCIFPDEFIPVAEKNGFIIDLGYLVFRKACQFIQRYQTEHDSKIRVNINVSVLQLLNNQFPEQAKQLADDYQLNPDQIVLELTETVILDGNKNAVSQLCRLNQFGFRLSLDDFGSGYSSINSFFDLPLKQIKVDKAMTWRALENPATLEYLKFITNLCQDNQVDVVIEGIESADMQRKFTAIGVNYLQGFWFGKPLSLASASYTTQI